jgi:DNA-directed RNA polymerase specialized sigma24 family protein
VLLRGLSYKETAEALGTKTSTVGTRLHRARSVLRKLLLQRMAPAATEEVRARAA